MQTLYAIDINWDTDGEDPSVLGLPSEVEIPSWVDPEDDDAIGDYLSDEYGYCHFGFGLEWR